MFRLNLTFKFYIPVLMQARRAAHQPNRATDDSGQQPRARNAQRHCRLLSFCVSPPSSISFELLSSSADLLSCVYRKDDAFGQAAAQVLTSLPKVQRFDFISLLMDERDRVKAQDVLKSHNAPQSDQQAWA